jgi:sugar phosphate isomerase/epimerase
MHDRREFLRSTTAAGLALGAPLIGCSRAADAPLFRISLAEWSHVRRIFAGGLDHLDFPAFAKNTYGIDAVEYVNQFFMDKASDRAYLAALKLRCDDAGVRSLLIMCDAEGELGEADDGARRRAVENHFRWIAAARFLGCHSIRVNAAGSGTRAEVARRAADSLHRLAEMGERYGIDVIVENHGGYSSDGAWLAATLRAADHPHVGALPDFGNFRVSAEEEYDRYRGVRELMPFARGVSAKSHDFDEQGQERHTDYLRMLRIVLEAGYRGFVGIEYEGGGLGELEGIRATKALLERVREELAAELGGGGR